MSTFNITFTGTSFSNPTNSVVGLTTVANGAAPGTSFGTVTTTLGGAPTFAPINNGGLAVQIVGSTLEVLLAESVNIMYRRSFSFSFQASGTISGGAFNINPTAVTIDVANSGAVITNVSGQLAATGMSVTVPTTSLTVVTIVASGSATLTLASSVGSPTMSEYNIATPPDATTGNFVTTLSASGGTGPYQWSCITDGSPMSVKNNTGVVAMRGLCVYNSTGLGGVQGTNWYAGTSQTAVFRCQDSLGAWATISVTCSVTQMSTLALLSAAIPSAVLIDPANATLSGSNVTNVAALCNGTSYTMTPSGTAPTVTSYVGPDGNTRNVFVWPNGSASALGAGTGFTGSSAPLLALFNQSGITNTNGTVLSITNFTGGRANLAFGNITDGTYGVSSFTSAGGTFEALASNAGLGATFLEPNGGNPPTSGWQALCGYSDGNICVAETSLVMPGVYSGGTNFYSILPKTNTFTPTFISTGGGATPYPTRQSGLEVLAPTGLKFHEREMIYLYAARRWGITFTPNRRATFINQRVPRWNVSDFRTMFGATYFRQDQFFSAYSDWADGIGALGGDLGVYVEPSITGAPAVFPERNGYVDTSTGRLVMPVYTILPQQRSYMQANPANFPAGYAAYQARACLINTQNIYLAYQGAVEVKKTYPPDQGIQAFGVWLFGIFGGGASQEVDPSEQYAYSNPSLTVFTVHYVSGGQNAQSFAMDDCSVTPNWITYDWYTNYDGSGTDTIDLFVNGTLYATSTQPSFTLPWPMYFLIGTSSGDGNVPAMNGASRPGTLAGSMVIYEIDAYTNPASNQGQMAQLVTGGSISGTRGNGNTLTGTPPVYTWTYGTTQAYQWYTYTQAAGYTAIAGQTGLTLTDLTAYAGETLVFQTITTNGTYWNAFPGLVQNAFIDPVTLPVPTLINGVASGTTGAAAGTFLANLYNMAMDATFTVTGTDVTIGPDNTRILAGAGWAARPNGTPVAFSVTQNGISGVPTPRVTALSLTPD